MTLVVEEESETCDPAIQRGKTKGTRRLCYAVAEQVDPSARPQSR